MSVKPRRSCSGNLVKAILRPLKKQLRNFLLCARIRIRFARPEQFFPRLWGPILDHRGSIQATQSAVRIAKAKALPAIPLHEACRLSNFPRFGDELAVRDSLQLARIAAQLAGAVSVPDVKPGLLCGLRLPLRPTRADVCQKVLCFSTDVEAVPHHVGKDVEAAPIDIPVDLRTLPGPATRGTIAEPA